MFFGSSPYSILCSTCSLTVRGFFCRQLSGLWRARISEPVSDNNESHGLGCFTDDNFFLAPEMFPPRKQLSCVASDSLKRHVTYLSYAFTLKFLHGLSFHPPLPALHRCLTCRLLSCYYTALFFSFSKVTLSMWYEHERVVSVSIATVRTNAEEILWIQIRTVGSMTKTFVVADWMRYFGCHSPKVTAKTSYIAKLMWFPLQAWLQQICCYRFTEQNGVT